jgi:hypothetical protein
MERYYHGRKLWTDRPSHLKNGSCAHLPRKVDLLFNNAGGEKREQIMRTDPILAVGLFAFLGGWLNRFQNGCIFRNHGAIVYLHCKKTMPLQSGVKIH